MIDLITIENLTYEMMYELENNHYLSALSFAINLSEILDEDMKTNETEFLSAIRYFILNAIRPYKSEKLKYPDVKLVYSVYESKPSDTGVKTFYNPKTNKLESVTINVPVYCNYIKTLIEEHYDYSDFIDGVFSFTIDT